MKVFTMQGRFVVSFRETPGDSSTIVYDETNSRYQNVGTMVPDWSRAALDTIEELTTALESIANHKFATTLGSQVMATIAQDALDKQEKTNG